MSSVMKQIQSPASGRPVTLLAIALLPVALLLTGCAASSPSSSGLAVQKLATPNQSGIVMQLAAKGTKCQQISSIIARKTLLGFDPVTRVTRSSGHRSVALVALQPGEYHIVHNECTNGPNVIREGYVKQNDMLNTHKREFTESLAKFTIREGEIVNIGQVAMVINPFVKASHIKVSDLSAPGRQWLQSARPAIAAKMKKRLAVTAASENVKGAVDVMCRLQIKLAKQRRKRPRVDWCALAGKQRELRKRSKL